MTHERHPARLRRRVDATPAAIAPLRRAVAGLASGAGFATDRVDDVALAVSEILTNVVVHAYRGDRDAGLVELTAVACERGVEVTIADEGTGMRRRDDSPGLGLGLAMATMVADGVRVSPVRPSGTSVWLRFRRDGGRAGDGRQ